MVWLTDARTPEGMRLYAIGDIHGCLGALEATHRAIEDDLEARPVADCRIVHVGDYVDRGPESRAVLDFLVARAGDPRMVFLRGNHDDMFLRGMAGDRRMAETWLQNGGVETLASYGVELVEFIDGLRDETSGDRLPAPHREFLEGLVENARFGDYYFVHAGIDPGRRLNAQDSHAQLWIREPFLSCAEEFPAVIVHGHTPVERVEVRPNRIGIDTGAVYGGSLSCLVLEGAGAGLLVGSRVDPLAVPEARDSALVGAESGRGRGVLGRVFGGALFGRRG